MIEVTASCEIDAPAEAVWSVMNRALAARADGGRPAGAPAGKAAS